MFDFPLVYGWRWGALGWLYWGPKGVDPSKLGSDQASRYVGVSFERMFFIYPMIESTLNRVARTYKYKLIFNIASLHSAHISFAFRTQER